MGEWKGLRMGQDDPRYADAPADGARDARLEKALEHLPKLKSAMAADGTMNYGTTVFARRRRAEVGGAGGRWSTSPGRRSRPRCSTRSCGR